jgi:hypothetical protein
VISLLLGDPSPSLRWRAAVELEEAPEDDEEVRTWHDAIGETDQVRSLLARLAAARSDPKAAGYLLCQLAYLGYTGPEMAAGAEAVFAHQAADGSWPLGNGDPPTSQAKRKRRRKDAVAPGAFGAEPYTVLTMTTLVPLRGVAAAGFATDPRAERAYDWLVDQRLDDGSWTGSHRGGYGFDFRSGATGSGDPEYRRLTRGRGCRSATTGAVACLALHPDRRRSDAARLGVDHLLARETHDTATLGWEVSRLVGLQAAGGGFTFYVQFDHAFLLDLASRCGVSVKDRRVRDLVAFLETRRGPFGLWHHPAHPQLSRWLSFDLEASLRRLTDGDWVGNEEAAAFTPYKKGRRRY